MQAASKGPIQSRNPSRWRRATERRRPAVLAAAFALALAPLMAAAGAADSNYKTLGGLSVYLGVLPAAMVQAQSKCHAEQAMHGGVQAGAHAHHMIAALFNTETGSGSRMRWSRRE